MQDLKPILNVISLARLGFINDLLHELFAGKRIERKPAQTAIEKVGATGHAIHLVTLDQHAAMHGPHALELFVRHEAAILRSCAETPHQRAVSRTQAIHPAISTSKIGAAIADTRWRIHSTARRETPSFLPGVGKERDHFVRINAGDEQSTLSNGYGAEFSFQIDRPFFAKFRADGGCRKTTAQIVVPISRPVGVGVSSRIGRLSVGWPFLQTVGFIHLAQFARGRGGGERVESNKLGLRITRAIVRRCVSEAVGGHHPVQTAAAHPMIDVPVLLVRIHKFNAGA